MSEQSNNLYIQCETGISGDMLLAAMSDLGVDLQPLQAILQEGGIDVQIRSDKCLHKGISGSRLDLGYPGQMKFRNIHVLQEIISALHVSSSVQDKTLRSLERLAEVEAKIHGIAPDEVHFHEIGAVDTLVDILGVFWALEKMEIAGVTCSSIPWFQGWVKCEHGQLPLPAPATAELIKGKPVYPSRFEKEIITPTGALLLDQLVEDYVQGPLGNINEIGMGLGNMDLGEMPNALRVFLYSSSEFQQEDVVTLESNVDHLTGEELGGILEELMQVGALDVLFLPGVMKKNRPGGQLQVICFPQDLPAVQAKFFEQTMSLGIRLRRSRRLVLPRHETEMKKSSGNLAAKEVIYNSRKYKKPEYESLKSLAEKTGRSIVQLRYLLGESGDIEE